MISAQMNQQNLLKVTLAIISVCLLIQVRMIRSTVVPSNTLLLLLCIFYAQNKNKVLDEAVAMKGAQHGVYVSASEVCICILFKDLCHI